MTGQIGAAGAPLLVVPIQARYGWQASFYVFGFVGVTWPPCGRRGFVTRPPRSLA